MSTTAELVRELQSTRDATLGFFATSDAELGYAWGPGKWSVRYLLHHLADSETVMNERIRRVLSEPPQTLLVSDQDAWAAALDYATMPLPLSRAIFESVRNGIIHLVGQHYETRGHLTFVHSVTGPRTLRQEMEKVARHNAHHLEQIRAALRRAAGP
jgi:hypothetical protein